MWQQVLYLLYTHCLFCGTDFESTVKKYMNYCMYVIGYLEELFLCSDTSFFMLRWMRKLSISYFDSLFSFLFQAGRVRAVGIVGIERKLEAKRKETDKNISEVNTTEVSRSAICMHYFCSFTLSFRGSWDGLLLLLRHLNWLRVCILQLFILFNCLFNICKGT